MTLVSTNPVSEVDRLSAAPAWYAAYTHPRHEKKVAQQLKERDIEHFLPIYRSVRKWKDRRKELDLVLFPGYLFVHTQLRTAAGTAIARRDAAECELLARDSGLLPHGAQAGGNTRLPCSLRKD